MEIIRKIIFYIFLAGYIIFCPLLILYSLGYIIDPLQERLIHTGAIHLSSLPAGAHVFLEKSRYKESTPATIQGLLPGEYVVRLEMKGYHSWTQKVLVEDGKAAVFDKILLIPNTWSVRNLNEQSFLDLKPLTGTEYFLLARGNQLKDYYIYDWKKDVVRPFLELDSVGADFRVSAIFSKEDSAVVLIQGGALWDRKYLYAQVVGAGAEINDISKLVTGRPLSVEWDPASHDSVFALYEGYVDRLDTISLALYPRYIEGLRGWGVVRDQLYIIDQNYNVYSSPTGKKDFKPVFESKQLTEIFAREKDFYEIRPVANDCVVFLGSQSAVIFVRSRICYIDEALAGVKYSPGNNRLLVWTRKAIGVIDCARDFQDRISAGNGPKVEWVFSQGKDIRQCFWAYEGSHIIFCDGNNVSLLELEAQGLAHVEFMTAVKENSSIVYLEAKGVLLYLGERDGKLTALDIVPRKWAVKK